MRPIAILEFFVRICAGETVEYLVRVNSDAGEVAAKAVCRIEGDRHVRIYDRVNARAAVTIVGR